MVIDSPSGRRGAPGDAAEALSTGGPDGPDLPDEPDEPEDDGPEGPDGPDGAPAAHDRTAMRAVRIAVTVVAVPLVVAIAFLAGRVTTSDATPTDVGADAGFARDMQAHHTQAVEMSLLVRDRTSDEQVRTFAYDLALTQQHQVGQLFGFLVQWGLPQEGPVMAWMHAPGQAGSAHHTVAPGATATASSGVVPVSAMPGMASAADLRRLRQAGGRSAEILYLRLMIAHHRGGVEMARALLERNPRPEVARLARSMVAGQTAEIAAMQQLLRQRGVATA